MHKLINRLRSCLCGMCSASRESMTKSTTSFRVTCRRLSNITGEGGKRNEVLYVSDKDVNNAKQHVFFFGGDVQDYPENMEPHPINRKYIEWNLEDTGQILLKRFPQAVIFVMKPTKMHLNCFSVYSNFVKTNDFGCPSHQSGLGSWRQLKTLYENILLAVSEDSSIAFDSSKSTSAAYYNIPLILVGFSKGCIVLNQLLYDLKEAEDDPELSIFVRKINEFYWLDGGYSGGKKTWVVDKEVVKCLSALPVKVFVHVTPYQVNDPLRSWIGREQRRFVKLLKEFGVDVHDTLHFDADPGCLENHFRVLTVF